MEKINFVNNSEPYLSAENLNTMQDNIETAINGIVESGSNENGSYVKYSDGTMICSHRETKGTTIKNEWGQLKVSPIIDGFVYPVPFIERPHTIINVEGDSSAWIACAGAGSTTQTMPFHLVASNPITNGAYFDIEYIAKGKWK